MIKPDPCRCMRCKTPCDTVVYMGEHIDPFVAVPLCVRCAILACFRCGKVNKP